MNIDVIAWIHSLPPEAVYATVFFVVGIESLGVALPGELTLMTAALIASHGLVSPWFVWFAGASGAIIGDSIGYFIGHTQGRRFLKVLSRIFPKHINPPTIKLAESIFRRHGSKTVFFGRFIALLRILAGPLAGVLHMPYKKFLLANASGGIVWSGITVWVVYYLGVVSEGWLSRLSWAGLAVVIIIGFVSSMLFRAQLEEYIKKHGS